MTAEPTLNLKEANVELIVFDDDGPEGYFGRFYFDSSWNAASWFVYSYGSDYHCFIRPFI